ncbi:asparagine synthase-related protein [Streptomyces sp. ST2-7A]|uniref:asparagine synthase-related protein n=1 Tax=Streptomyces sp. ST2-7A TaxID=2907214 RepID=UPI001F2086F7|nr:asparagine synthase-related protein [Streptomyces sp. ST2-7A]MCE7080431.1 hypothetical protein [Streptomyces sp. ST2-7A]
MLRMRLTVSNGSKRWEWDGRRWASGSSWIEPYDHPAIEHEMTENSSRASCLVVREVATGEARLFSTRRRLSDPVFQDGIRLPECWPLQAVTVHTSPNGEVRVSTGERGVAPVYLRSFGNFLAGSWDLLDLDPEVEEMEFREVTATLSYRTRYSTATPFRASRLLTERATAVWDAIKGLRIHYPEAALHSRPRILRLDAEPVSVFADLLQKEVSARPVDLSRSAVELSGGMDSTVTAVSLSRTIGPMRTAALILDGEVGVQQARRRNQIIEHGQLGSDVTLRAGNHGPFHPAGFRFLGRRSSPTDGTYVEAMGELYRRLSAEGVRWLFTGIGGDELCFQRPEEREITGDAWNVHPIPDHLGPCAKKLLPSLKADLAPASVLHASTLAALAVHSRTAMSNGLWPISPLASPLVLRFAESLPLEWRRNKRLMRALLEVEGFSRDVIHPRLRENFSGICEKAMFRHGLPLLRKWLPESVLVDFGIIDPRRLRKLCDEVATSGRHARELYRPLALEGAFRSLR